MGCKAMILFSSKPSRLLVTASVFFGVLIALPPSAVAHNLSEADATFFSRVFAFVYPDIVRAICRDQSPDFKKRMEDALTNSGLTALSEPDICADNICESIKGATRINLDKNFLREMIENFRTEQVSHRMARHSSELEKECHSIVPRLETVKNGKRRKAEDIMQELFEDRQKQ